MKLTLSLVVLTLATAVFSFAINEKNTFDKQKKIAQLLARPQQPTYFKEIVEIGNNYDIFANVNAYKNTTRAKEFIFRYKHDGFMPFNKEFNIFEERHMEQARMLFDMFYFANDFEVFYKTACWARNRFHPGMYVYALSVAVTHREDLQGVTVPPPYETYPHLFVTSDVLQKTYQAKMRGYNNYEKTCDMRSGEKCVFYANHTNPMYYSYGHDDSYQAMQYYTEDIGLNAFYTYWHLEHPFWLGYEYYGKKPQQVGELFMYSHHQIFARYYLERLSHGFGEVEPLHYWDQITEEYMPHLRSMNGFEMVGRPQYTTFKRYNEDLAVYETRIRDAIDSGYIFSSSGQKMSLYDEHGMNYLGMIIQGYADSINKPYYGQLYNFLRYATGYMTFNHKENFEVYSNVMQHFATVLRDPVFYRLYKRIDNLYYKYINHKNYYSTEELTFHGVSVKNFNVDKLMTYFDEYDTSLSFAVDVANEEDASNVNFAARHYRLNHQPYNYHIEVESEKPQPVMVRIFLGPKYDNHGYEMDFDERAKYFVEMDRFPYMLKDGKNVIERNSHESTVFAQDYKPYEYYFKEAQSEDYNQRMCGFPERLALPRGSVNGVYYTMFVMITPYNGKYMEDKEFYGVPYCGAHFRQPYPDDYPMGYPFNRPVESEYTFYTPNMYFKDVVIYHKPYTYKHQ